MSLLDPERRYDAMAADPVSASVAVGPAGPHALCGTLDGAAFASSGARQVQLDTDEITAYFREGGGLSSSTPATTRQLKAP